MFILIMILYKSEAEDAVVFDWEGSLVRTRHHAQIRYSIDFEEVCNRVLPVAEENLKLNELYRTTLQSREEDTEGKSEWLRVVLEKSLLLGRNIKKMMEAIWFSLGIERRGSDFVIREDYYGKNVLKTGDNDRQKRRFRMGLGGRRGSSDLFYGLGEVLSDLISPVGEC